MNSIRMCGCACIRFERGSESTRDLSVLVSDLILQRFEDYHYLFFLFVQGLLLCCCQWQRLLFSLNLTSITEVAWGTYFN